MSSVVWAGIHMLRTCAGSRNKVETGVELSNAFLGWLRWARQQAPNCLQRAGHGSDWTRYFGRLVSLSICVHRHVLVVFVAKRCTVRSGQAGPGSGRAAQAQGSPLKETPAAPLPPAHHNDLSFSWPFNRFSPSSCSRTRPNNRSHPSIALDPKDPRQRRT